jgi:hypothetical protein
MRKRRKGGENVAERPANTLKFLPIFVSHSNMSPRCSTNPPKAKDTFSFFLFQCSFYFFLNFLFLENASVEKSNMLWKKRNMKNWRIFGERENKNANGRRRVENHI